MTISRKQVGVLFRNYKQGNLKATPEEIKVWYGMTESYFNNEDDVLCLLDMVNACFDNDVEKMNELLEIYRNMWKC